MFHMVDYKRSDVCQQSIGGISMDYTLNNLYAICYIIEH